MKTKTLYIVPETNLAASDNYQGLRDFANQMGYAEIAIEEITVPWLEDGDVVTVSKCVGSVQNDDGISIGGEWVDMTGTWVGIGGDNGELRNDTGELILIMSADTRYNGFPYRNVRVVAE